MADLDPTFGEDDGDGHRIRALRKRIIELQASLDPPNRARRRTRNLLVSGAGFFGGLILSSVTGPGGFAVSLASAYVLMDNLAEDSEVHVHDRKARAELQRLTRQIEALERAQRR